MKISLDWLSDFVTWKEKDPQAIADRLTLATAEVEGVEMQGKFLEHCCVGKIVKLARHPGADRLTLVEVETDQGMKKVVCGGTNLRDGMLVAFAHVGATVKWHGGETMTLAKTKIRGEESEGMICAAEELELQEMFPSKDGHAVIDLESAKCEVRSGQALREALGQTDTILDINNTAITTRPDLFSHIGFARECVALGLATWKATPEAWIQKLEKTTLKLFPKTKAPFKVHVDCPELVPFYNGALVEVHALGTTPEWMVRRLAATGWRSVSLPVDITNYVTMEEGMPMHSFDADDFQGDIRIRTSKAGEMLKTLDNVERKLPDGAVVISDDAGIFDLLGIMGGLRSSTKETTKRIYMHAAIIDPVAIRRAIVATGHRTEASTIYEKGVPRSTSPMGFLRAVELMKELAPGFAPISAFETWGKPHTPKPMTVTAQRLESLIGIVIPEKITVKILEDLGYGVETTKVQGTRYKVQKNSKTETENPTSFIVTAPPHRQRDVQGDVDIIEDVARIYGYDKIPDVLPLAPIHMPERERRVHAIRDVLCEYGGIELVPLSFVSPQLLKRMAFDPSHARKVQNPLGEETSLLQSSVIPHLLGQAEGQIRQIDHDLSTFTISRVFLPKGGERTELGMLLAQKHKGTLKSDPFLRTKRTLTDAFGRAGYSLSIEPEKSIPSYAHPGRIAAIVIGGQTIGTICEVHPAIRDTFGLPERAAVATIDIDTLLTLASTPMIVKTMPRFPAVTYDLTITHRQTDNAKQLLEKIRKSHPLVEEVEIADIYQSKDMPTNESRLTIRCTYRAADRTLTEEEAKKAHGDVERLASHS